MSEKVIKIKVNVSTNRVGSNCEDEIEIFMEDDLTPEQEEEIIEEAAKEWMWGKIDLYWERI